MTVEASTNILSAALDGRSPAMYVLNHLVVHAQIASVLNQVFQTLIRIIEAILYDLITRGMTLL